MQTAKGTRKTVRPYNRPEILTGPLVRQTPRAMHMRHIKPNLNAMTRRSMYESPNRRLENFVSNVPMHVVLANRTVRSNRGNLPFKSPRGQLRAASTTALTRRSKPHATPVANTWKPKSILKTAK